MSLVESGEMRVTERRTMHLMNAVFSTIGDAGIMLWMPTGKRLGSRTT
jgi:hypothetical protein